MGKINCGRLILGGVVAGVVSDILSWLVDGIWLAPRWAYHMRLLNHAGAFSVRQMVLFNLIGIAGGIAAIWIYAAIRPRFGPGVRTAVYAGLVSWFMACLLPNSALMYTAGLFGGSLTLYTTLGALVEVVVGTIAGAALYREAAATPARPVVSEEPPQAVRA